MSIPNTWRGDAVPVSQVDKIVFAGGNATGAGNITLTVNGKNVVAAVAIGDTSGNVSDNVQAALFAATGSIPEFAKQDYASDGLGNLTITSVAGIPFVMTLANTAGIGTTAVKTTTANADGPNWVTTVTNWSLGHIPTTGETAVLSQGADVLFGMGNLTWTPDNIDIRPQFQRAVGLPPFNSEGIAPYYEYLPRALPVPCNMTIGGPTGAGPSRVVANITSNTSVINVLSTGPTGDGYPAVEIYDASAVDNVIGEINVCGGSIGIGLHNALTGNATKPPVVTTIRVTDGELQVAGNASFGNIGTVNQTGGTVEIAWGFLSLNIAGGDFTAKDGCAVGSVTADGGTFHFSCRTTSNPVFVFRGGGSINPPVCDCTANTFPRSLGNGTVFTGGAILRDPDRTITLQSSTAVTMDRASLLSSEIGHRYTVGWSAAS